MSQGADKERVTQQRLIRVLSDGLGWTYLGDWQDRAGNSAIEAELLCAYLLKQGYSAAVARRAVSELEKTAFNSGKTLYDRNQEVYERLRYGINIKPEQGEATVHVQFIDWGNPGNNSFSVAEEVTVIPAAPNAHVKRPDLVLYVNGIALGVIELKRSTVAISEGIRQNLDNQKKEFIEDFFSTMQLVMAGSDTEGLRYGTIQTKEKYYLRWKEQGDEISQDLDSAIAHLCRPERFLELIHDFVVFDAGVKKLCRPNQYFGVKAAQQRIADGRGGIIWHTQGSGKSLTMVWLAKWLLEHYADARILIVTDRDELDKQIEKVFAGVGEQKMRRTRSGAGLVSMLNAAEERLMCSLIHKFGRTAAEPSAADIDKYLDDVRKALPEGFTAKGRLFVFVDEAHRTQSGLLHKAMKLLLPDAILIGFTGTPLLRSDKAQSIQTFGPYIHTYKYDEAVRDGVVLDLRYEARDIEQEVSSPDLVDKWFDAKTKGLNDVAKAQLKKRWGTMQTVMSSKTRLAVIVQDILMDMNTRARLMDDHGNAILVAGSIYEACKYYELLAKTELKGKVAIVTSYSPGISDIKGEETGEGATDAIEKYDVYQQMLADWFGEDKATALTRIELFEEQAKDRFISQPGQLKLLIVVDKLLTGFDAPPATYLYIDKQMRDHGLFQAICRVNRLDGDDKEYGYIVDYKDLFKSLEQTVQDYTGEGLGGFDAEDVAGLLKDRLTSAKQHLDEMLEQTLALCEPVREPRGVPEYLAYFVPEADAPDAVRTAAERTRVDFYKAVGSLVRAFAALASELTDAGYTPEQAAKMKGQAQHFTDMREAVKLASGDAPDLKAFEPGMRALIDNYLLAKPSKKTSDFEDLGFLDLFVKDPEKAVAELPYTVCTEHGAAAVIENNIRKVIIDESPVNPKYYERMSELLDELIKARRQGALAYREYLKKIAELARTVKQPANAADYPSAIDTSLRRALYDNVVPDESAVVAVSDLIWREAQDGWRSNFAKRRKLELAVTAVLSEHGVTLDAVQSERMMELMAAQSDAR